MNQGESFAAGLDAACMKAQKAGVIAFAAILRIVMAGDDALALVCATEKMLLDNPIETPTDVATRMLEARIKELKQQEEDDGRS